MSPVPRSSPPAHLVSVGTVLIDLAATVPAIAARDDEVRSGESAVSGSGPFTLLARAAAHGLTASLLGPLGTGPLGDATRRVLADAGVGVLMPPHPRSDSGARIVLSGPGGAGLRVVVPGAEEEPPARTALPVGPGDLVHVTGAGLHPPARAAAILDLLDGLPTATTVLYEPGTTGAGLPVVTRARLLARTDWWIGTEAQARGAVRAVPERAAAMLGELVRRGAVVATPRGVLLAGRGGRADVLRPDRRPRPPEALTIALLLALADGRDPAAALAGA